MEFTEWDYGIFMSSVFQGQKSTRAFTLIEMIVVITIIGILIALGVPMFSTFKEKGRRAQCANNLKQWYAAFLSYAAENNGALPPEGSATSVNTCWYNQLQPYTREKPYPQFLTDAGTLANAAKLNSMYMCPSKRFNRAVGTSARYPGYCYNNLIDDDASGNDPQSANADAITVLSRIANAERTVLIFACYDNDFHGDYQNTITNNASGTYLKGPQNEGLNMLFAGGNVRFVKNTELRQGAAWVATNNFIWQPSLLE